MKQSDLKMTGFIIQAALILTIAAIVCLLLIGTIYALVRPANTGALFKLGKQSPPPPANEITSSDVMVYSGVGRLRIPLSDSSIMILSIAFPYPSTDAAFMEELAARTNDFKELAASYFSALPPDRLSSLDEEAAKYDILRNYNSILRLGSIQELYFSDLLIIEGSR